MLPPVLQDNAIAPNQSYRFENTKEVVGRAGFERLPILIPFREYRTFGGWMNWLGFVL